MTSTTSLSISDVMTTTTTLHAELMTANDSSDLLIIHASIISAVEGHLTCVRSIAAELIKVELEGVDSACLDQQPDQKPSRPEAIRGNVEGLGGGVRDS